MTRKVINTLCLAVVSLILCSALGCVSMGHRLYSGPALTSTEVALIFAVSDCRIQTIRDMREKEEKALGEKPQYMLELLPGEYNAVIQFGRVSFGYRNNIITAGRRVQRTITVQAGNIYVIYPEIKGEKQQTWRPIIVNGNNYSKEECEKSSGGFCPDKDKLRESALRYLQGDRHIMSFHSVENTPILYDVEGENRVYKGFWW
jgi:hypothetical protein